MELAASQSKLLALKQYESNIQSKIQQLEVERKDDDVKPERNVRENKDHFHEKVYPDIVDKAIISEEAQNMASKSENNTLVNFVDEPKMKTPEDLLIKKANQAYAACK